jgi:beta-phosphoglucomutase
MHEQSQQGHRLKMPAVIFDLDGTLIDSYAAHFEAWTSLAAELGHPLTEPEFQRQFGRKNEPILEELHQWAGLPAPDAAAMESLAATKEERFRSIIGPSFPEMKGAAALIGSLRAAGWRVAVGSSAPRDNIDFCLAKFESSGVYFDAVACGCDVEHGKPAPDVFLLAASRLGVAPGQCVVVEDAAAGVEAAKNAGMGSVGLCSPGRTREELAAADLVVDSLQELNPERFDALRMQQA